MHPELTTRTENGSDLDVLVWRLRRPGLVASTAAARGGVGLREWVLNAEVAADYRRVDTCTHVDEIAAGVGLSGVGVGVLTAASVAQRTTASDGGVDVASTVGLSHPMWAAGPDQLVDRPGQVGTINIVVTVPVRLEDGALLNALTTATEAKAQALGEAGYRATGTPSDTVTVVCAAEGEVATFAGPRSAWGAPLARAVHGAVLAGAQHWIP